MSDRTIRQLVAEIEAEVRETELLPARAADLQNRLSALLGNVNRELTDADLAYKRVLLDSLSKHEKANRARIEAETSPEYRRFREAKDVKDTATEVIRSLRAFLRNAGDEMRLAR